MSGNNVELRNQIGISLKPCFPDGRISHRRSADPTIPRGTFEIKTVGTAKQLEINIWDEGTNTAAVEEIADNVEENINFLTFTNDKFMFFCHLTGRQYIDDPDKNVIRLRLQYNLIYHEV